MFSKAIGFWICLVVLLVFSFCPTAKAQDVAVSPSCKTSSNGPVSPTGYRVIGRYPIGGEGGWDYISIDSDARRLYVSHATQQSCAEGVISVIRQTAPEYYQLIETIPAQLF